MGNGTNFCYQHDIRAFGDLTSIFTLQMHNNANCPIDNGTGLILDVDMPSMSVSLQQRFYNPNDPIYAMAQGSFQPLDQKGILLGHGAVPKIEEFTPDGAISMTVSVGPGNGSAVGSYRAFRSAWVGCPNTMPDVVVAVENGELAVYMSWNGATEYDTWKVYAGASNGSLALTDTVPRNGFETRAFVSAAAFVQAEAVWSAGSSGCNITGRRSLVYATIYSMEVTSTSSKLQCRQTIWRYSLWLFSLLLPLVL